MSNAEEYLLGNPHHSDLNPLLFGTENCLPGHSYGPGVRFYYLIHYVVSGKGLFRRGEEEAEIEAGTLFIARPGDRIYYRADEKEPWNYIWVGFDAGMRLPAEFERLSVQSDGAGKIFKEMLSGLRSGEMKNPEIFLTSKLWELVALFACKGSEEKSISTYVLRAKTAIEAEYMKDLTVGALAARLHLDRSYFSTIFRRDVGVSPQEYLNEIRLNTAASLLAERNYPPTLAAQACGYPDISHFSRMFRRKFGVSPREYRAEQLKKKGFPQ